MKHAILMTIYKDAPLVNRIITSYPLDFNIFIHIDKKSHIKESDIVSRPNLYIEKILKVNWGGYNHVLAMLSLLKKAIKTNSDYYHWVTGQDIPCNPHLFDEKLKEGYSYLEHFQLPKPGWCEGGLIRYQIFGLYDIFDAKKPRQFDWIQKIEKWQKRHHFIRPFRDYSNIYAGSGYFTLYKTDALLLLKESPKWHSFYRFTFCGEESIAQTILLNSNRRDFIINDNLRYIDWTVSNPPKILDMDDYEKIERSQCLFCRKVDSEKSSSLLFKYNI